MDHRVDIPRSAFSVGGPRLVADGSTAALLAGPLGGLIAKPWLDRATLMVLRRYFFPLSRLWAAARTAHGSPNAFYDAVPMGRYEADERRLSATLARFEEARAAAAGVERHWRDVVFGDAAGSAAERVAVETARLSRRHAYNALRADFRFLLKAGLPRIRLEVATPAEVEAIYGPVVTGRAPLFDLPTVQPVVRQSHPVPGVAGTDSWLVFDSPSSRLGDPVYARVHTPDGVSDPPTLIFGHGVCVEFDHWKGLIDEVSALVARGIRVIRPEAPFHGRRVPAGSFGGEQVLGRFPLGALDTFSGALSEWAVLTRWARATTRGPVAFGGSSLGALTAQLAADRFRDHPDLRPDALFLVTHCGSVADAILKGELSRMFDAAALAEAKGWSEDLVRRVFTVVDPGTRAPIAADRIVSVQGALDTVTPFRTGGPLIDAWDLPAQNRFVWVRGHFTIPMTMLRNPAPVARFVRILQSL